MPSTPSTRISHSKAQQRAWRAERRELRLRSTTLAKEASRDLRAILKAARDLERRVAAESSLIARRVAILDGRLARPV